MKPNVHGCRFAVITRPLKLPLIYSIKTGRSRAVEPESFEEIVDFVRCVWEAMAAAVSTDQLDTLAKSLGWCFKKSGFVGRSSSCRATAFSLACEWTDRSVPFGKCCLSRPLVFSFVPRCQGFCPSG